MEFELPDDIQALKKTVRDFCEKRVKDKAREWDHHEKFPMEIVRELGQLGLLGIRVGEEYGGAAMGSLAVAVVVEEVARYDGSLALTVASHNGLGTSHIRIFGNDVQKQKYLPKLATGEWLGAWALTEPGSGSDSAVATQSATAQPAEATKGELRFDNGDFEGLRAAVVDFV